MNTQLTNYINVINNSVAEDSRKVDFVIKANDIYVVDSDVLGLNGVGYTVTFDAFCSLMNQIYHIRSVPFQKRSKITLYEYLWNNRHNGIYQYALQQHLAEAEDKPLLVRTYNDEIRVFLKPTYSVLNNTEVMLNVLRFLTTNDLVTDEFRIVESRFNRDFVKIKLLLNDQHNGEYGRGIYFTNNEVGEGGISFHSLVKRHVCDNSIISAENFLLYHRGDIQSRIINTESSLLDSLTYSGSVIKLLETAKNYPVYAMPLFLENFKEEYSASDEFISHMQDEIDRTSNTIFGAINGITWAAQFTNEREDWEHIAGKILNVYEKKYAEFL